MSQYASLSYASVQLGTRSHIVREGAGVGGTHISLWVSVLGPPCHMIPSASQHTGQALWWTAEFSLRRKWPAPTLVGSRGPKNAIDSCLLFFSTPSSRSIYGMLFTLSASNIALLPKVSMVNASHHCHLSYHISRCTKASPILSLQKWPSQNREAVFPNLTSNFKCNVHEYRDNCLFVPPWEMILATRAALNTVDVCDDVPTGYL